MLSPDISSSFPIWEYVTVSLVSLEPSVNTISRRTPRQSVSKASSGNCWLSPAQHLWDEGDRSFVDEEFLRRLYESEYGTNTPSLLGFHAILRWNYSGLDCSVLSRHQALPNLAAPVVLCRQDWLGPYSRLRMLQALCYRQQVGSGRERHLMAATESDDKEACSGVPESVKNEDDLEPFCGDVERLHLDDDSA